MRLAFALAAALPLSLIAAAPAWAQTSSPGGNGCEDVIGRWQAFATEENQGGHMDLSVFNKIETEIDEATAMCQSGQDAQASRMVEASKRRHGY